MCVRQCVRCNEHIRPFIKVWYYLFTDTGVREAHGGSTGSRRGLQSVVGSLSPE